MKLYLRILVHLFRNHYFLVVVVFPHSHFPSSQRPREKFWQNISSKFTIIRNRNSGGFTTKYWGFECVASCSLARKFSQKIRHFASAENSFGVWVDIIVIGT